MNTKFCENKIIPNAVYLKKNASGQGPIFNTDEVYWDPDFTKVVKYEDITSLEDMYSLVVIGVMDENNILVTRPNGISTHMSDDGEGVMIITSTVGNIDILKQVPNDFIEIEIPLDEEEENITSTPNY